MYFVYELFLRPKSWRGPRFTSFHFLDSGLYLSNGFFIFIYFEWRDTENQQFGVLDSWSLKEIVRTRRFDCIGLNKTGSLFDLTVVAWKCISLLVRLFLVFEWIFCTSWKQNTKSRTTSIEKNSSWKRRFALVPVWLSLSKVSQSVYFRKES